MKQIILEIMARNDGDKFNMQNDNSIDIELLEYYIVYKYFTI